MPTDTSQTQGLPIAPNPTTDPSDSLSALDTDKAYFEMLRTTIEILLGYVAAERKVLEERFVGAVGGATA